MMTVSHTERRLRRLFLPLVAAGVLAFGAAGAAAQVVDEVSPTLFRRGSTTRVTLSGSDLGDATAVTVSGQRVEVSNLSAGSDSVSFDLAVGNRALAGARDLTVAIDGGADIELADAIEVQPGEGAVFSFSPDEGVRGGGDVAVTLQGLNLDNVSDVVFDVEGLTTTNYAADPADPTRATVTVRPRGRAPGGAHDARVVPIAGAASTLRDAFTVIPGPLALDSMTPSEGARGETLTLTLSGDNLDLVEDLSLGAGVQIESLTLVDPTQLDALVTVRRDATPAEVARDVTASGESESDTLSGAFTVLAGTPTISRIRPSRVSQGASVDLQIEGENLDGLSRFEAGEGVTIEGIDSLSAVAARVSISVAADATIGLRTVELEGTFGTTTATDGLQIAERVELPPSVNFPDVQDLQTVEVGARKRVSIVFRNGLEVDEEITLAIVGGDVNDFRFIDADAETLATRASDTYSFLLPGAAERQVTVEFRPSLPARAAANVDVSARGERIGGMTLSGTGAQAVLRFNPAPPASLPPVAEGETSFEQLNTLSETADRVLIERIEVFVERNDGPFPEGADLTDVLLSDPLPPERENLFGVTLLTIEATYPAGSYEGELLIHTDRARAPLLPVSFFTTVTASEDPDMGADMGADAGSDMGVDADDMGVEPDRGGSDLGDLGGEDSGRVDQGGSTPTPPPADEGCSVAGGRGAGGAFDLVLWGLALVAASTRLRRRRDPRA